MALMPQLRLWLPGFPGAQIFSYVAGSTTKRATWSDSALTVSNSNPMLADANGLFTAIYLDPALNYKFVISPSTDTDPPTSPIFTQDNVMTGLTQVITILAKVSDYAVSAADGDDVIVLADATLGNITVALYTSIAHAGKKVRVVKIDNSTNTVTIDPFSTQTWSGQATVILTRQWQADNGTSDGANWVSFARGQQDSQATCEGRLTLVTGVPVPTTDQSAKTSAFFTPCNGNRLSLYDGTRWNIRTFAEITLSLAALTASKPYDVFAFDNAGAVNLEVLVWTSATVRATNLTTQDGVLVKTGALTRRYLGTIYINASGGQTDDTLVKRYVFNYYNQRMRPLTRLESTASWTYTTDTFRQANAATANQVEVMVGFSDQPIEVTVCAHSANSQGNCNMATAIGEDATNAVAANSLVGSHTIVDTSTPADVIEMTATLRKLVLGYHFYAWLERSTATGTTTWSGVNGDVQSGIVGIVWA